MRQVLGSLLRRFVDDDWLAARWRDGEELAASLKASHPRDGAGFAESAGPCPRPSPRNTSARGPQSVRAPARCEFLTG